MHYIKTLSTTIMGSGISVANLKKSMVNHYKNFHIHRNKAHESRKLQDQQVDTEENLDMINTDQQTIAHHENKALEATNAIAIDKARLTAQVGKEEAERHDKEAHAEGKAAAESEAGTAPAVENDSAMPALNFT